MKRSLYLFLCIMLALTVVFVSCGEEDPTLNHSHTYSDEWSHDETNHWYAATCGCENEKSNVAPHVDANSDSCCDICGWDYDHSHTFAADWTYDETNHWHKVTCGCSVEVSGKGAHVDKNNDGHCDVCPWAAHEVHPYSPEWEMNETHHWHSVSCDHTVDPATDAENSAYAEHVDANNDAICDGCGYDYDHTHTYASEWSQSATEHWHAVSCGHDIDVADKGAHVDKNNDGTCDVCAYASCTHTYDETAFVFDENTHWYASTCGHNVKKDEAEHVDETTISTATSADTTTTIRTFGRIPGQVMLISTGMRLYVKSDA